MSEFVEFKWTEAPDLYKRAVQIHVTANAKAQRTANKEDVLTAYDAAEMALLECHLPRTLDVVLRIGDFVRRYGA